MLPKFLSFFYLIFFKDNYYHYIERLEKHMRLNYLNLHCRLIHHRRETVLYVSYKWKKNTSELTLILQMIISYSPSVHKEHLYTLNYTLIILACRIIGFIVVAFSFLKKSWSMFPPVYVKDLINQCLADELKLNLSQWPKFKTSSKPD